MKETRNDRFFVEFVMSITLENSDMLGEIYLEPMKINRSYILTANSALDYHPRIDLASHSQCACFVSPSIFSKDIPFQRGLVVEVRPDKQMMPSGSLM